MFNNLSQNSLACYNLLLVTGKIRSTANALIYYDKKLLLLLRDNNPSISNPNRWSLIGGKIEDNETPLQALKREIMEEICTLAKSIKYLGKINNPDNSSHFIFLVKMTPGEVKKIKLGNEGQDLKFFRMDEIRKLNLTSKLKAYIKMHGNYLEAWFDDDGQIEPVKLGLK
jgi:8-oxo-dGTP diphosphatase